MKKVLLTLASMLVAVAAIEIGASYALFRFYSHKESSLSPSGSAVGFLIQKATTQPAARTLTVTPDPLYRPNRRLGYTTIPGIYRVLEGWRDFHDFRVTVPEAGVRATSYRPAAAGPRIVILGNSYAFGWGLDDELTFPWLLQTRLPNYRVLNMSMTGYSDVHMMLQYETLVPNLESDDLVIITYGGYLPADVAAPSFLRSQTEGYEMALGQKSGITTAQLPYAGLKDDRLVVNYRTIFCPDAHGYCSGPEPELTMMVDVGKRIYDRILDMQKGRLVIAFIAGPDDDPIIAHLRTRGATVIDIRPRPRAPDYDDAITSDRHPGAFRHFKFYCSLINALAAQSLVTVVPSETATLTHNEEAPCPLAPPTIQ